MLCHAGGVKCRSRPPRRPARACVCLVSQNLCSPWSKGLCASAVHALLLTICTSRETPGRSSGQSIRRSSIRTNADVTQTDRPDSASETAACSLSLWPARVVTKSGTSLCPHQYRARRHYRRVLPAPCSPFRLIGVMRLSGGRVVVATTTVTTAALCRHFVSCGTTATRVVRHHDRQ